MRSFAHLFCVGHWWPHSRELNVKDCFPIDGGYYTVGTAPKCTNGWGWLQEGECGCGPDTPGYVPGKGGCSIKCTGEGPLNCGLWCSIPEYGKWAIYAAGGLAGIAILWAAFSPKKQLSGYHDMDGLAMLPAPKSKSRRKRRRSKKK